MFLLLHGSVLLFHCIVREGTESLYKGELLYSCCCCYLATCCQLPCFHCTVFILQDSQDIECADNYN